MVSVASSSVPGVSGVGTGTGGISLVSDLIHHQPAAVGCSSATTTTSSGNGQVMIMGEGANIGSSPGTQEWKDKIRKLVDNARLVCVVLLYEIAQSVFILNMSDWDN